MNTHVRDNLNAINSQPASRVYHSVNQALATGIEVTLTFNTERFDTDTIHDTGTNPSRLTCKTAGKYLIGCSLAYEDNASGVRKARFLLNGVTTIAAADMAPSTPTLNSHLALVTLYQLAVNDYVEIVVVQNSGATLQMVALTNFSPEFWMQRLSD